MSKFITATFLLGLTAFSLHADQAGQNETSQPQTEDEDNDEDLDLFNKDKQVYYFTADFLYWTVNEGATDYALKMRHPAWSTTVADCGVGHYHNADFDWNPGLRVAFGFFRAPHYWDATVQYTFFSLDGDDEVHAPKTPGEFLVGTWQEPSITTPISLKTAKSHIAFNYNLVDFMFSRRFFPNPHLKLSVTGGITGVDIKQTWKVRYEDLADNHSHIRNTWSYLAAGFRLGLHVDWFMGYDLYLTGQMSSALLSGRYNNRSFQKTDAPTPGADNSVAFRNTHFRDTRLAPSLQMLAGLSWQKTFESVRATLFAGYEMTEWFNLHQIYRTTLSAPTAGKDTYINDSAVSLQGLTVSGNLDF